MKLSAALTKLKNLKSQLSRCEKYISKSLIHFEDEEPEYDYETELTKRMDLIGEILDLKSRIMTTNAVTEINFQGSPTSINWLILRNAELRSELAYWTKMVDTKPEYSAFESRTKDTVKKVLNSSFSTVNAKERVEQLESDKEELEAVLARANMETDLQ